LRIPTLMPEDDGIDWNMYVALLNIVEYSKLFWE
jgi:hypothetical protein